MKRTAASVTILATTLGLTAPLPASPVLASPVLASPAPAGTGDHRRGELVSATHLRTVSKARTVKLLKAEGYDPRTTRYGIDAYRLVYRTVDEKGRLTKASGLLLLPRSRAAKLKTVSYTHGTTSYKPDAPSTTTDGFALSAAYTYASAGFAAVAPDYVGLGVGPGVHPYLDLKTETSASLDMLRAARQYSRRIGRDVLVTGFSQGASPALGLSRALQRHEDRRFRLRATAPVAGAYDFGGEEIPALLDGKLDRKLSVVYTAYFLTNWNRRVHVYDDPAEVFKRPYAGRAAGLFDGTVPGEKMFPQLPDRLSELLTPQGYALLRHPKGELAELLRDDASQCRDWRPRTPVRLFVMRGDEQVTPANTASCADRLKGARTVWLKQHTSFGSRHLGSDAQAAAKIVRWFRTF